MEFGGLDKLDNPDLCGKEDRNKNGIINSSSENEHSNDELDQNAEEEESWPTAPPADYLDTIRGYEMVSFDAVSVPPPLAPPEEETPGGGEGDGEEKKPPEPDPIIIPEIEPKLTEQQVKAALLSYIDDRCCYGKGAAKNMNIKTMEYVPAYHYELQTFSEKRETAWTYAPYRPGTMESYPGGVPPLPWEIEEPPTQMFKDEVRLVTVPNTASTKTCHRCRGIGGVTCRDCNGKGWSRCLNCHGDGWLADSSGFRERCFYCQHSRHGHGQQDCNKCHTKGKVNCSTCDGQGQIRCFIQLSITWKVHTAEHIVERLELPHDLIREVSGQVAFEQESAHIKPVTAFNEQAIKDASSKLVFSHSTSFPDLKILRQRHQVRIVPVTKVVYEWKGKTHAFFVYGYENKIHLPKYPQNCCWGCNIL